MKKKQIIIGIDVSKSTLDVFIHGTNFYFIIENNPKGFFKLLETSCKVSNCQKGDLLFCFENTGKYSQMLSVFLHTQSLSFVMEPALKIKKSLGLVRGKDDKIDAKRIALYAYEKRESLKPTVLPGKEIDQIKSLLTLREKLVKHRTAYKNGITDLHDCYRDGENDFIKTLQTRLIKSLNDEIEKVEGQIKQIIQKDERLLKTFILILSVKGIGKIIAFYFIAYTANFTLFRDARAFACHSGIAPFGYSSGTIKGKSKVHKLADRRLKGLLTIAAMGAIRVKGEYRQYYIKRTQEEGKNKMSTLNIIRNKLVYRVFAVVNRETPYIDFYKFAA
jgi:transposase